MSEPAKYRTTTEDPAPDTPVTLLRSDEPRDTRSKLPILIRLPDLSDETDASPAKQSRDDQAASSSTPDQYSELDNGIADAQRPEPPREEDTEFDVEGSEYSEDPPRESDFEHVSAKTQSTGSSIIDYAWQVAVCLALVTSLLLAHAALTGRFSRGAGDSTKQQAAEQAIGPQPSVLAITADEAPRPLDEALPSGRLIAVEFNHDHVPGTDGRVHPAIDSRSVQSQMNPNVMYPPSHAGTYLPQSRHELSPPHVADLPSNLKPPPR